ncbi:MAG: PspA/IM30 family protein [Planktothrix sp. GU0601_MAG3]|nr:MAG: PspA/IM30 family protein [Planktothrix sp. GU0601_MAG3]
MSLFDRINRLVKANLNDLTAQAQDPEKFLNSTLAEMQENLAKMRQAVDHTTAIIKRTELQYQQANSQANQWHSGAELALRKGDEDLAKKALERKVSALKIAEKSKKILAEKTHELTLFKQGVEQLENKIAEVKAKINYLKQRKQNTANEQLENLINGVNTHSTSTAFERLEEKVKELEKPTHRDHSSHILNEPKPNQNPENILETAIQETQKIIEQSVLNKDHLKKQLIEQETTIKLLNQNLINLKILQGKLTNKSGEISTLNSENQVNSKLDRLLDFNSDMDEELDVDEELKRLRQEINKMQRKSHE